jgi:Tfp pilus assembly protein PilE
MVVVMIIGLLVSIIAPATARAVKMGYLSRTRAQVQNQERGREAFAYDNNTRYPGQTTSTGSSHIASSGSLKNNGSEFLARALWTDADITTPAFATAAFNPKTTKYSAYDSNMLITGTGITQYDGKAISDGFNKPMPILYFVANLTVKENNTTPSNWANGAQFDHTHNSSNYITSGANANMTGTNTLGTLFTNADLKARYGLWDRVKSRYVLIAPGLERKYFDDDDVTN